LAGLKKYVEWMSRGRKTDRVAYVMSVQNLPQPKVGAEWQIDDTFNAAEELLRHPNVKEIFKTAIDKGSAVILQSKL
jgi:hypothetical protein